MLFFYEVSLRLNAHVLVHVLCLFHVGLIIKSCSGFLPLGLDPACSPSFGTKAVIRRNDALFLPERIGLGQLLNVILFWHHHLQCMHVLLSSSYPSPP